MSYVVFRIQRTCADVYLIVRKARSGTNEYLRCEDISGKSNDKPREKAYVGKVPRIAS